MKTQEGRVLGGLDFPTRWMRPFRNIFPTRGPKNHKAELDQFGNIFERDRERESREQAGKT